MPLNAPELLIRRPKTASYSHSYDIIHLLRLLLEACVDCQNVIVLVVVLRAYSILKLVSKRQARKPLVHKYMIFFIFEKVSVLYSVREEHVE